MSELTDRLREWCELRRVDIADGIGDDLRAAADRIEELEGAITSAARELHGTHHQAPLDRHLCVVCGAEDGNYPCTAHMVADGLQRIAAAVDDAREGR
jgi:hypothetical protein